MLFANRLGTLQSNSTRNRRPKRRSTNKRQVPVTLGIEKLEDRTLMSITVIPMSGPFVVSTLVDEIDGDYSSGDLSLREALVLAAGRAGDDVIRFDASLAGGRIALVLGALAIDSNVTIEGLGADLLTIDAQGASRVFYVGNVTASLSNLTLTGGRADIGGGIYNAGSLTLDGVVVTGNVATDDGGGIYSAGGLLNITGGTISNNTAADDAGGLYSGGSLLVDGTTFSDNLARQDGGGVYTSGSATITNSIFTGNTANTNFGGSAHGGGGWFVSGSATITDSTFSGNTSASNGGGIFVNKSSSITITNSTFTGNTVTGAYGGGGGIHGYYNSSMTITGSTITGNTASGDGGGISVFYLATATITDSTITNNTAGRHGGGISIMYSTATITNSTVAGNTASQNGGGIYSYHTSRGDVTLLQATVSGNSAGDGGGIFISRSEDASGRFSIQSSTITLNTATTAGGGIFSGTVGNLTQLDNTIVANNTAVENGDLRGSFDASSAYNLIGVVGTSGGLIGGEGNLYGTVVAPLDPHLGALADNGGPTMTHALLANSPAVNAGDSTSLNGLTNDQRGAGFDRIVGSAVDIGAFEYQTVVEGSPSDGSTITIPDGPLVVSTTVDEQDGDYSDGDLSLREALFLAKLRDGDDVIRFAADLAGGTISLGGAQLIVDSNVSIEGLGAGQLTIDAQAASRVFYIANVIATLSGLTVTGGQSDIGGGIYTAGTLLLDDVVVTGNAATDDGGGIYNGGGVLTITDSVISNNTSVGDAGGLYSGGSLVVNQTTFSANSAGGNGGGLYTSGTAIITGCTFTANTAASAQDWSGGGGGIYVSGSATISSSTIAGNTADRNGGGIYVNKSSSLTITDSDITGNTASNPYNYGGGGIFVYYWSSLTVSGSNISGNTTTQDGGGIYAYNNTVTITDSSISGNTAGKDGGGIFLSYITATITNSTIDSNVAGKRGGGIYSDSPNYNRDVILTQVTVSGNSANEGGGLFIIRDEASAGHFLFRSSTITLNTAVVAGGGIYSGTVGNLTRMVNTIVAGNTAAENSDLRGGFYAQSAYNLIGVIGTSGGLIGGEGNLYGSVVAPLDARLAALADNGSSTKTHALLSDSPAVNAGDNTSLNGLTNDQRGAGYDRIVGSAVDIGAFEFQTVVDGSPSDGSTITIPDGPFVVSTTVDEQDGDYSDGDLSLREALFLAKLRDGDDVIRFAAGLAGGTIHLGGAQLIVDSNVSIEGLGAGLLRIDAQGASRVIYVANVTATLSGLTVTGGQSDIGSGIYSAGTLILDDVVVTLNAATDDGGGIYNGGGVLRITDSVISSNTSGGDAGGLYSGGSLIVSQTTFAANSAGGDGGGLYTSGTAIITGCTFTANTASSSLAWGGGGGGIYVGGSATITSSTIAGNTADHSGGGIYVRQSGSLTIIDSSIAGNTALNQSNYGGGGVFVYVNGSLTISGSTISGNTATQHGGGIYVYYTTVTISDSTISGNTAGNNGGGMALIYTITTVTSSTIDSNVAGKRGGGIYSQNQYDRNVTLAQSTVSGNSANEGGGLFINRDESSAGHFLVRSSTITLNTAVGAGGGLYSGTVGNLTQMVNTIVAGNAATENADLRGSYDTSSAYNLIGVIGTSGGLIGGQGNLYGTLVAPLDAHLGALADNGGSTKTHALLAASSAVNAGGNAYLAGLTHDQRGAGYDRIVGAAVDIGAFEQAIQTVAIDVMPGSNSNPVNLRSNGMIPVVIFTTTDFDASTVDAGTLQFAGASVALWAMEDSDGDGDLDMVLHFNLPETDLLGAYEKLVAADLSDGTLDNKKQRFEATLTGQTTDGSAFKGTDNVDLFVAGIGVTKFRFNESFDETAERTFASTDHWFNRVGTDARVDAALARAQGHSGALRGHRGNDVLRGGANHDTLLGGAGQGMASGGMGGDYVDGQGRRRDKAASQSDDGGGGGLDDQPVDALSEFDEFFTEFDDAMAELDVF